MARLLSVVSDPEEVDVGQDAVSRYAACLQVLGRLCVAGADTDLQHAVMLCLVQLDYLI